MSVSCVVTYMALYQPCAQLVSGPSFLSKPPNWSRVVAPPYRPDQKGWQAQPV
jgi:hypothetical protein